MNDHRYITSDLLFAHHNARHFNEQFHTCINEINSALANALPRAKAVVGILQDCGREKEAEIIAKEIQQILDHKEKLSEMAELLRNTNLFHAAESGGRRTA